MPSLRIHLKIGEHKYQLCCQQVKSLLNILPIFVIYFSSNLENNLESITLKKPNQVYYEIYKKAREKAKEAKKEAILAFLEAKNIGWQVIVDSYFK